MKMLLFFLFLSGVAGAQNIDVLHYQYALNLNDQNDTISGVANITFIIKGNTGSCTFDLASIGENGKGMKVLSVTFSHPVQTSGNYVQEEEKLTLLDIPGKNGDIIIAAIWYKGIPADGLIISKNKFGDRTFFADNWPNRAHHWIPCIDNPADKASFEFQVSAPSHYQVVSNGVKVEEKNIGNGFTYTHWKENLSLSTKVMVIGVATFATKYYSDSTGSVPVSAWVYPKDSTKGFYDYALTPGIIRFFSNYIAPFPFQKLANVQSTTIFGGMENASAIFYAENSVTGNRNHEDLMAHEIAHQWFGNAASEKSFAHLWLSEGFATYLTNLYIEDKYGKKGIETRLKKERDEVRTFAQASTRPVVDFTNNLMSLLNANSYQKGSWVLHMLRQEVGDTAFQKIIQTYYRQYKGGNAETSDFRKIAETITNKDLKLFFEQWLFQPGIPSIDVLWIPGQRKIRLVQKTERPFQFPLEVAIPKTNGQSVVKKLWIQNQREEFSIDFEPFNAPLQLDPETKLLFTGRAVTATEGMLPNK